MAALTQDRNTPSREGVDFVHPLAASTTIYAGALVMLDASGNAKPASQATGLTAVGVAQEQAKNGSTAGAASVRVRRGVFAFFKSGGLTRANIGDEAYAADDQTVKTGSSGASKAGKIIHVDDNHVWVEVR